MSRGGNTGGGGPRLPRPVQHIELSWDHYKLRIVAALVFLVIGVIALTYAIVSFLGWDPGWQTIEPTEGSGLSCADDFVFLYDLGAGNVSATNEYRDLLPVYTDAAKRAYQIFNCIQSFDGVTNLNTLNAHPNEAMTVDPALYEAFRLLAQYEDRSVYLGPIHEFYDGIFYCQGDWETPDFDPRQNKDLADFFSAVAAYARDDEAVSVELLENSQLMLKVSPEYQTFAEENGVTRYLDLSWMTNAFVADYLADALIAKGYTRGALSSYDGFVRNLDGRAGDYSLNIFDWHDGKSLVAAVLQYSGPAAAVSLRSYPMSVKDAIHYYQMESGEIRTAYVDPADGLDRTGDDDLTCISQDLGCAEILLRCLPAYLRENLDTELLRSLASEGITALWTEGTTICHTQPEVILTNVYSGEDASYSVQSVS